MDRRTAEPVVLAAVAIVALAAAAATLPSATESGGSGDGSFVAGSGDGGLIPTPPQRSEPIVEPPALSWLVTALAVLAALALVLYVFLYRREALGQLVALAGVLALIALLFWLVSHIDSTGAGLPGWGGSPAGDPGISSESSTPSAPPVLLLLIVGAVLLGAVVLVHRDGRLWSLRGASDATETSAGAAAVGRAARRAVDRIETTSDVENEVYRAWREMTGLLDVSRPASSTSGEFADAAIAAGMDPDDVGALTRLFEDVRYGGDEPTAPTERRALTILRRIEATYAPEDADP